VHDRFKLTVALAAGVLLAVIIGQFETGGHDHSMPQKDPIPTGEPLHQHQH
jgi:hypothetical protein